MVQVELPPRYRIIEEVGQGGMAVVYRAHDATLKREVAVKVLHSHLLAEGESKARLEREAQAVAKLQHENIVQVYDYSGSDSRTSFIVTEFVDGQTLKQFLGERSLPLPELAAAVIVEVAGAVEHAHKLGILHRDIKPENVMVRKDGLLKLMDFGVAQVIDLERMTVTGQLIGSPAYMAPELIEGKPVDFRTDVFALGIMMYQLATGALPFTGRNPHEVFKRITEAIYPDPRAKNPLVGTQLQRTIARALARRPDDRHPDMGALITDLRGFLAEAGLPDTRKTLQSFFSDPAKAAVDLEATIFAGLLDSARTARRERRNARALELWNRALALRPGDAAVAQEIRRMVGGKRLQQASLMVGLAGLLIAGLVVAARSLPGPTGTPADRVATRARPAFGLGSDDAGSSGAAGGPGTATAVTELPPVPTGPDAPRPRGNGRATPAPPIRGPAAVSASGSPKMRTFSIGVMPQNVEVFLDGKKLFDYGPGSSGIDVPWNGLHTIELRNPCCFPAEIEVGPSRTRDDEKQLRARLRPKPANLTMVTQPAQPEAKILLSEIGGSRRFSATDGKEITVPFDDNGEFVKRLQATVFVAGKPVAEMEIQVRAGERKTFPLQVP